MSELNVRIIHLEPMRVASVLGYGSEPENAAWEKLVAWARPRGMMKDKTEHRIFGFNNPNPSPGSPNYGYEFWITVDPDVEVKPGEEVEIKEIPGGDYAIYRCEVEGRPYETIPAAWKELVLWLEDSPYEGTGDLCLEEHLSKGESQEGDWDLDLYLPIQIPDR
jgi:DNA gyrase inhibitor GyrI